MTPDDFRRIALALDGAEERAHMGATHVRWAATQMPEYAVGTRLTHCRVTAPPCRVRGA